MGESFLTLILLASLQAQVKSQAELVEVAPPPFACPAESDAELKAQYDEFNRDYFKGKLPADTRVVWESRLNDELAFGYHTPSQLLLASQYPVLVALVPTLYNDACPEVGVIRLNPRMNYASAWWQLVLLHEMAHQHLWLRKKNLGDHDTPFQKEMLRLAKQGAFAYLW